MKLYIMRKLYQQHPWRTLTRTHGSSGMSDHRETIWAVQKKKRTFPQLSHEQCFCIKTSHNRHRNSWFFPVDSFFDPPKHCSIRCLSLSCTYPRWVVLGAAIGLLHWFAPPPLQVLSIHEDPFSPKASQILQFNDLSLWRFLLGNIISFFPVTWICFSSWVTWIFSQLLGFLEKKQDYQFFSKGVCTWILRYPLENIVVGSHFGSNSEIRPKLRIRICGWQTDFEVSGRFNMLKYAWNIIISLYK